MIFFFCVIPMSSCLLLKKDYVCESHVIFVIDLFNVSGLW